MGAMVGQGAASGAAAGTAILPGWGTVIGAAVGGIAGAFSQRSADKKRKAQLAKIMRQYEFMRADERTAHMATLDQFRLARRDLNQGYDLAKRGVTKGARSAEIDNLDRSREALAQIEAQAIQTGKWSSSGMDAARLGLSARTSRVMADISARTASALGQIEVQRGSDIASTRFATAQANQLSFQNKTAIRSGEIDTIGADVPGTQDYSAEIGGLFAALGSLFASQPGEAGTAQATGTGAGRSFGLAFQPASGGAAGATPAPTSSGSLPLYGYGGTGVSQPTPFGSYTKPIGTLGLSLQDLIAYRHASAGMVRGGR